MIAGLISLLVILLVSGCSKQLVDCPVIIDSRESSNKLSLVPNSHDKSYSAILTCGTSDPVLVATFDQCLSQGNDQVTISAIFLRCASTQGSTDSPLAGLTRGDTEAKTFPWISSSPAPNNPPANPVTPQPTAATQSATQPSTPVLVLTEAPTVTPTPPLAEVIPAEAPAEPTPRILRRRPATH